VAPAFQSSAHTVSGKGNTAGAQMAFSPGASTLGVVEAGPRDCRGNSSRLSGRPKPNREDLCDAGLDWLGHTGSSASGSSPATDLVSHEDRKSVHEESRTQAVKQAQCFDIAPSCPNFTIPAVQLIRQRNVAHLLTLRGMSSAIGSSCRKTPQKRMINVPSSESL
jgi:hypothetical protein